MISCASSSLARASRISWFRLIAAAARENPSLNLLFSLDLQFSPVSRLLNMRLPGAGFLLGTGFLLGVGFSLGAGFSLGIGFSLGTGFSLDSGFSLGARKNFLAGSRASIGWPRPSPSLGRSPDLLVKASAFPLALPGLNWI